MQLERWNGRLCIFEEEYGELDGGLSVLKKAYSQGLIPENTRVFVGSSSFFGIVQGTILKTYRYRDNWNGWHDVGAYSLPHFTSIGKLLPANGSVGRHRDEVIIV